MVLKKMNAGKTAVLLIFLFYISTNSFWGHRLFHESNIFAAVACLIPMTLMIIQYFRSAYTVSLPVILLVFAMYAVILISSSFDPKCVLFYGMCLMLFWNTTLAESEKLPSWFCWLGLFFAAGSLINLLLPGLYKAVILPGFAGSSQYARLVKWTGRTSSFIIPGFSNQTSFNACHLVYGIGFLFCTFAARKKIRPWQAAALFVLFVCLVLTNKRAHFLFLFLSLAVTYYVCGERKGKRLFRLLFGTAVLVAVIFFLIPRLNVGVFRKLAIMLRNLEEGDDISSGRWNLYSLAIRSFLEHPLFGIGWGKFQLLPDLSAPIQTHNIYLQLLCETGLVGLSVFLMFFIGAFVTAVKNCRLAVTVQEKLTAGFCVFMQAFFLVYGLTGNPLYDPPYYIPYFIISAFTFSFRIIKKRRPADTVPAVEKDVCRTGGGTAALRGGGIKIYGRKTV